MTFVSSGDLARILLRRVLFHFSSLSPFHAGFSLVHKRFELPRATLFKPLTVRLRIGFHRNARVARGRASPGRKRGTPARRVLTFSTRRSNRWNIPNEYDPEYNGPKATDPPFPAISSMTMLPVTEKYDSHAD